MAADEASTAIPFEQPVRCWEWLVGELIIRERCHSNWVTARMVERPNIFDDCTFTFVQTMECPTFVQHRESAVAKQEFGSMIEVESR
jgi:hypothetical protein